MKTTFIYALTSPGARTIRYFGKADDPKDRRATHIRDAKNGAEWHVSRWIRKLLKAGQRPDVHVLCEVPQDDYARFERAFITLGRQCGFDLTNETAGGDGSLGRKHTPSACEKVSASLMGNTRARGNLGKKRPSECIEKTIITRRGKKLKSNTSGFVGVHWHKANKKWMASIGVRGQSINLGYYASIADAVFVRHLAENKYFSLRP